MTGLTGFTVVPTKNRFAICKPLSGLTGLTVVPKVYVTPLANSRPGVPKVSVILVLTLGSCGGTSRKVHYEFLPF